MEKSALFNYPKGIWRFEIVNKKDIICRYVSPTFVKSLGYEDLHFEEKDLSYFLERFVHPEDRKLFALTFRNFMESPMEKDLQFRVFDGTGDIRWIYVKTFPLIDEHEGKVEVSGLVIDITKEKIEEERKKRRKEYLESFLEIAKILLEEEDPHKFMDDVLRILGKVAHADRAYWFRRFRRNGRWYLSQENEWVRKGVKPEIDNPRLQDIPENGGFTSYHTQLLTGGIVHALVKDLTRFDRDLLEPQEIKAILNIPFYIHGTFLGVIGFDNVKTEKLWDPEEVSGLRLVTDMIALSLLRYEKEKEIRELVTRLKVLMEAIPDLIVFKDTKGNWLYANNKTLHMFDLLNVDYKGRSDKELSVYVPEDLKNLFLKIMGVERGEDAVYVVKKGRKKYYIRPENISITDPEDNITGILIIGNDITSEIEMQKRHIEVLRREAHLNRMESLGVLTGGMAHKFNNELSIIMGNLSLLRVKIKDESLGPYIERSIEAAENISAFIKRMLLFVGDGFHGEGKIDVTEEIRTIIDDFREEANYDGKIELNLFKASLYVKMSRFEFREAVLNVLVNAAEAMKDVSEKMIKLNIYRRDRVDLSKISNPLHMNPNLPYCVVQIRDYGKGMTKEVLEHVFEPFYTTKFIGRGLGLSTLFGIMGIHGGGIDIDTGKHGTTFSLYFPLKEEGLYENLES